MKFDLTSWFLATKGHHSQVDVQFGDAQEEAEDFVWPILGAQTTSKLIVLFIVVVIDRVSVQELVSNHLRIIGLGFLAVSTPIHPLTSSLLATMLIGPIC